MHRGTGHLDPEAAAKRRAEGGSVPRVRDQLGDVPQVEGKSGKLEVSDVRRLKALKDENMELKKLLAKQMLDNAILKEVASRK